MLRQLLTGFLILCFLPAICQVTDDFSDGDFTNNPTWTGTAAGWTIANNQLRSSPSFSGASPFFISTPSTISAGVWRTYFRFSSLTPTSGNHAEFWIMSDQADLSVAQNGYFIRIGDTNKDICLFRFKDGIATKIIDGPDQIIAASSNSGFVRLTRTANNQFALWAIKINAGQDSVLMGTVTDNQINTSTHLGILVKSTPSNYGKHYFDDFTCFGPAFPDQIAPSLLKATLVSPSEIDLEFDEPLDQSEAINLSNYSLIPSLNVVNVALLTGNQNIVRLNVNPAFSPGVPYTVSVLKSKDNTGNIRNEVQSSILTYLPDVPYRTIVINELMVRPNTNAGTSAQQVEWIELHNPGSNPVTMNGWTIRDASPLAPKLLPTRTIQPGEYLILTSATNISLFPGLQVVGMAIPTLNDDADSIVIADSNGNPVDIVPYNDNWYQDNEKKLGGYSLEMIQPKVLCTTPKNWRGAAFPEGGSAGEMNTIFSPIIDNQPPVFQSVSFSSGTLLLAKFSEGLDASFTASPQWYQLQPGNIPIVSAIVDPADSTKILIQLGSEMQTGENYTLTIAKAKDQFCNIANSQQINFQYFPVGILNLEFLRNSVSLIPNPGQGAIRLSEIEYGVTGSKLTMYNLLGKVVFQQLLNNETIDVSHLPPGIYTWRWISEDQTVRGEGRWIKEKNN